MNIIRKIKRFFSSNAPVATDNAPKAVGPYSQAQTCNATWTTYISGQLPVNPKTGRMPETIEAQTAQSLDNIGAILEADGGSFANVVKTTVLLADINDFAAMNGVYAKYFTEDQPARVCFQVAALPMGAKVEIDAIAVM